MTPTPGAGSAPFAAPPARHVLRNPGVVGIGLGSLLSDTGHEMATAALPGFLRSISAPAAALGAIEGIADAALSASKVAGGILADRPDVERKSVTAVAARADGFFGFAYAVGSSQGMGWDNVFIDSPLAHTLPVPDAIENCP